MLLKGNLTAQVENAALCAITLSELDYRNQVIIIADINGAYSGEVPTGSYKVTLTPAGESPKIVGMLDINHGTTAGALEDMLVRLKPQAADPQILTFIFDILRRNTLSLSLVKKERQAIDQQVATLTAMQADIAEIKTKLTAIENSRTAGAGA